MSMFSGGELGRAGGEFGCLYILAVIGVIAMLLGGLAFVWFVLSHLHWG